MISFDKQGREILDPTPVEMPVGMKRPESLQQMIQRLVRAQISQAAVDDGHESFEEANDFDIDEDDDLPLTVYEQMGEEPGYAESEDGSDARVVGTGVQGGAGDDAGAPRGASGDSEPESGAVDQQPSGGEVPAPGAADRKAAPAPGRGSRANGRPSRP